MNTETRKLLRQLEQATSQRPADDGALDVDTRMLREGWLALDRLLQAPEEFPHTSPTPVRPVKRKLPALDWVVAVSALLFIAVLSGSFALSNSDLLGTTNSSLAQGASNSEGNRIAIDDRSAPSNEAYSTEWAWDDSFDHQLAAASLAIRRVGESREIGELHFLQGELLEISNELTGSSL